MSDVQVFEGTNGVLGMIAYGGFGIQFPDGFGSSRIAVDQAIEAIEAREPINVPNLAFIYPTRDTVQVISSGLVEGHTMFNRDDLLRRLYRASNK